MGIFFGCLKYLFLTPTGLFFLMPELCFFDPSPRKEGGKEARKEGRRKGGKEARKARREGRKEGRKQGGREGGREGRKEGRNEGPCLQSTLAACGCNGFTVKCVIMTVLYHASKA